MSPDAPVIAAFASGRAYAGRIANALGVELLAIEERTFEDGEHKIRPLATVRGRDVFVVQSLFGDRTESVNDRLIKLLFLVAALRDLEAAHVTAVTPYLAYARKDRRTKPHDPLPSRYVAQLLEAAGVQRVIVIDVHNRAAFENAFRVPALNLEAAPVLADALLARLGHGEAVIVSPDAGGYKRAQRFREAWAERTGVEPPLAFHEKKRSSGVVSGDTLVGDVSGRAAVIVDDLISTGGTLARTAAACRRAGAISVHAAATHGLFTADAGSVLAGAGFDGLLVTDTVSDPAAVADSSTVPVERVGSIALVAEAIRRLHAGLSVSGLSVR